MWLFSEFLLIPGRKPYFSLNIGRIFFVFIDYNPLFGLDVLYTASKYTMYKSVFVISYLTVILRGRAGYDTYNQRGRRPSWLLSAHIRQVREE